MIVSKKGENVAIPKLVTVIIVILVIAVLILFLTKADILNYLRNLPSYKYNETDKTIDEISSDTAIKSTDCPVKIGELKTYQEIGPSLIPPSTKAVRRTEIMFWLIDKKGEHGIWLFWNDAKKTIDVYNPNGIKDRTIGIINNDNSIKIEQKWFDQKIHKNKLNKIPIVGIYIHNYAFLPSVEDLKIVDGSYRRGENLNSNDLCKKQ